MSKQYNKKVQQNNTAIRRICQLKNLCAYANIKWKAIDNLCLSRLSV